MPGRNGVAPSRPPHRARLDGDGPRALATLRAPAGLRLADCTVGEARRFGITLEIGASDELCRRWATAFAAKALRASSTNRPQSAWRNVSGTSARVCCAPTGSRRTSATTLASGRGCAPIRRSACRAPTRPSSRTGQAPRVMRRGQPSQATATSSAEQTSSIRRSLSRPSRSTSVPTETLSTESRFTAEGRGIGSSPGSSSTSLGIPRIVVVHGPISVRRRRGIATSRDSTTTGRRPTSGTSHHQTSPRAGRELTTRRQRLETRRDRPTHRACRAAIRRKPRMQRRSRRRDAEPRGRLGPRR
jgi:hypothetical protein